MEMELTPVRLPGGLVKEVNLLVKRGLYANKSDAIRDAIRRLVLDVMVGIIPNTGDSVKEVREIRKKLAKEKFDLNEVNRLVD